MTGITFRLDIAICDSAVGHLNHATQLTLTCACYPTRSAMRLQFPRARAPAVADLIFVRW